MPFYRCDVCRTEGQMKRCARCKKAYYCSVACQKKEWKTHKPNCLPANSAVQDLVQACRRDLFPDYPAAYEFGFDNLLKYHRHVKIPSEYGNMSAEHVLLGMLENLYKTVGINEDQLEEAYLNNALDDYIQSKIKLFTDQRGIDDAGYFSLWLKHKLIIGPTRIENMTEKQVREMRDKVYQKYYK